MPAITVPLLILILFVFSIVTSNCRLEDDATGVSDSPLLLPRCNTSPSPSGGQPPMGSSESAELTEVHQLAIQR